MRVPRADILKALAVLLPVAIAMAACKDPKPVAAALIVAVQPSATAQNGVVFAQQPAVQLHDDKGSPVGQAGVEVTAHQYSGNALLGGTLVATTNASGLATFTDLKFSGVVGNGLLRFSSGTLTEAYSESINIVAGPPTQMMVSTNPSSNAQSSVVIGTQPRVQLLDVSGNPATQSGVTVTATTVGGIGTLTNATALTNTIGIAAFSGLTLSGPVGSYTLRFTAPNLGQIDAPNLTFLSAGPVSKFVITTQPSASAQSGVALAAQPAMRMQDAAGNNVNGSGVIVTATTVGSTSTLSSATASTNTSGIATFSGLAFTGAPGSHTLRFIASVAPAVDAASATTLTAGPAAKLTVTTQPPTTASTGVALTTQPVIQLRDGGNNAVAQAGVVVTATTVSGLGTMNNGTATTNASGVATFSGLALNGGPNNYTFRFTATSLTSADAAVATALDGGPAGCTLSSPGDADSDRLPDCVESNTGVYVSTTNTGTKPNDSDTDDDGIQDGDEVLGSTGGLNLPGLGVNPLRRDILLEFDWFDDPVDCAAHSHRPTANTIAKVVAMFAGAPTNNPNATTGVNIIADYGQGGAFTGGNLIADADAYVLGNVGGTEYTALKTANFATDRQAYFHYVLMPHRYGTSTNGSSGQAFIGGADLIVSLYCANTDQNVANTIAHELGHNLNLRHGGNENTNWKPNYNSVMNYKYQFAGVDNDCTPPGNGVLNFSIGSRPPLDETNLDERTGVCGDPAGPGYDWNGNALATDFGFARDINIESGTNLGDGLLGTLTDYNDWANIFFGGITGGANAGFALMQREVVSCPDVPIFMVRLR
jgi:hypothetical protein